ncbi:fumarylacetoacetate hydrolase family protein [Petrachloros mirabilis]
MRLVIIESQGKLGLGILTADEQGVLDLGSEVEKATGLDPEFVRAIRRADVPALLELDGPALKTTRQLADGATPTGVSGLKLRAPITRPPKVLGIGGNFRIIFDSGWSRPAGIPPVFWKSPTSIIGPGDSVVRPRGVRVLQPEPELVLVMGRRGWQIPADDRAFDYLAGYTMGNDVSNIDVMASEVVLRRRPDLEPYGLPSEIPFNLGLQFPTKSRDTYAPLGPWLVTCDELDWRKIELEFSVNGKVKAEWNVRDLVFSIPEILAYISSVCTLEPGDIIFTGVPHLIEPMQPGDTMEHKGTGLGVLHYGCIDEQ